MCFSTVFNHSLRLHVHEVAAGPPAHQYGLEMHPHVVVNCLMVGCSVDAKGAVGVVGLYCGGNPIHNVGLPRRYPGHCCQTYYIMQSDVLLLSDSWWLQSMRFPSQSWSTRAANSGVHLSPLGIPCTIGKVDFITCWASLRCFGGVIHVFSNPGEEAPYGHKVPLVAILSVHLSGFFLVPFQQEAGMICTINALQYSVGNGLLVIPDGLEILVTLGLLVFHL